MDEDPGSGIPTRPGSGPVGDPGSERPWRDLVEAPYEPTVRVALNGPRSDQENSAIDIAAHRATPYRPDSVADGWAAGGFVVRAASVRGDAHRLRGVPRQDDLAVIWRPDPPAVVIAVADGVSAAPLSHLGASTACRYAVESLLVEGPSDPRQQWPELVSGCAWAIVELAQRLSRGGVPDPAAATKLYATTLCAVTVRPLASGSVLVDAVCVGDSALAVIREGRIVHLLGDRRPGAAGLIDLAVVPLPLVPRDLDFGTWELARGETLLVGTDGIWDPVGDGTGTVGEAMTGALGGPLPTHGDFLRLVDFSRITHDDDRTLVAVRWGGD